MYCVANRAVTWWFTFPEKIETVEQVSLGACSKLIYSTYSKLKLHAVHTYIQ